MFDFMFRQQMYYKYTLGTDKRTYASILSDQKKRCLRQFLLKTKPNKMLHTLLPSYLEMSVLPLNKHPQFQEKKQNGFPLAPETQNQTPAQFPRPFKSTEKRC